MKKLIVIIVILFAASVASAQPTGVRGPWTFPGIITAYAAHGFMYFDANIVATACVKDIPSTITNVGSNLFTVVEQDSMTLAGDTIITKTRGSYVIFYSFTFVSSNNDDFRFSTWVNSAENPIRIVGTTTGTADYSNVAGFVYLDNVAPLSKIKFRITNLTDNDDPTIRNGNVLIYKLY